jgi:hypothetical protein
LRSFPMPTDSSSAPAIPSIPVGVLSANANQTIDLAGRHLQIGAWSPLHTTTSANLQVGALVKKDTPLTHFALYQSSKLAQ